MPSTTVSSELCHPPGFSDLYLMFKHEESPEGALHAETELKKVG
jgi:hypothetical protein